MTSHLGDSSGPVPGRSSDRVAPVLAALVAALSLFVLLLWFVDPSSAGRLDPGSATMKVNTALCFLVLALSLLVRRSAVVGFAVVAVAGVALASLVEWTTGVDLGIDELLVRDPTVTSQPADAAGRMAQATAVCLVLLAAARAAVQRGAGRLAQLILLAPLATGCLALLGYLFRVEQFYRFVTYATVALPTALAMVLLTLATAFSVPQGAARRLLEDRGAGATLVRHIMPVALLALPLLGALPLIGVDAGLFGERFSVALTVASAAGVLVTVAWVAARRLDRIDRERLSAQDELRVRNTQLRERRDLEWRRAEGLSRSLGEERARFHRSIGKVDDLIWTVEVLPDGELRPEFTSGDASGLFGGQPPAGHDRGRVMPTLVHPDDAPLLAAFDDKLRAGTHAEVELRIIGYDGVVRWAWVRATPRRERTQLFADGISTNVTERRQLAERREHLLALEQEQVRKLRQLNQLRDELLAVTGHELRTPLSVLLGYAELLLEETDLSAGQRKYLDVMANRARQIALLVEDIFDLAKFSAGLASIDTRPVPLHEAVVEAVEQHRPAADAADVTIDVEVTPVTVAADPARLRQILDNLLSNAVKYSLPGGHVSVLAQPDGDTATIAVCDAGIGIPESELEHVFDRMFRASSAKDRDIQGTGLGLSVAKALVEAHAGTISVTNRPEGGTRFTVAIPVQRVGV